MGVGGIAGVEARMTSIQQRFAVPQAAAFATVFKATQTQAATTAGAARPGTPPLARPAPEETSAGAGVGGAPPGWAANLPDAGKPWADEIAQAAGKAGVDARLLAALVRAESGFQPDARSHAGAIGLAQLMPATARGLGVDPHDPAQNLAGGARFLREMLDRFGSVELALAAYNAGPARVARAGGVPAITETQNYVRRVSQYYAELKGAL